MEQPTAIDTIDTDPRTATPRRPRRSTIRRARRTVAVAVLAGLLLVACGDDDGTASTGSKPPAESVGNDRPVKVELVDFAFENLPESVPAGTKLTVVNNSTGELHELVAFRLPDTEKRSVDELAHLPLEELATLFSGEPATVLLAPPGGGDVIPAVGDGTLTEPGRYFIVCAIPTGADPAEYLEAAANSNGEPPQIAGAGAPHIAHGMYGELVVEG